MFRSVLIANRGEIAVRIARTCRELGIAVHAVYSTEDRHSRIVQMADQAVHIGPAPARRSYLNIPAIIEAARRTGAEAIHPGYGFLSENADFAEVCQAQGIAFIGPPAPVIERLGNKMAARQLMASAGLPLLPGSVEPMTSIAEAEALANDIGYPVMLKAVAGGGGRGIRIVRDPADLAEAYRTVEANAKLLFGDGRLYVERYLPRARHVEVQILADAAGNVIHLGERDCSVQRRHQKLVEEAPAPRLSPRTVARLREAAVRGAKAANYVGAGTFEFLVDEDGDIYFLEVNCRIQVEHPVTEMITGVDLVAEQVRIAAGEPLRLRQEDVRLTGVAIECRVNVEDPDRGFVPAPGTLTEFAPPAGPFVRVDTHGYPGYRVPAAYDSLLAKVVAWGPDRDSALRRMRRALAEFTVSGPGVATTIPFAARILSDPDFCAAQHDTSLLARLIAEAAVDGDRPPAAPSSPDGESVVHHSAARV
ncbi:MAG TPA: acetyl-CoA carboxylase biotin carboxylase subunit [Micromonospora sp.]